MKTKDVLLTAGEIKALDFSYDFRPPFTSRDVDRWHDRVIAKAQLNKVIKWGEGHCPHAGPTQQKKYCTACWQELKKVADGDK